MFVEADNPVVGLLSLLFVGFCKIRSCEITVFEGQRMHRGDEMVMFYFGCLPYCLILRSEVKAAFDVRV